MRGRRRSATRRIAAAAAAVLVLAGLAGRSTAQSVPGSAKRIECAAADSSDETRRCRVDLSTYLGYRVFEQFCTGCHASDALGSSFAPNLLERVAAMDEHRFVDLMEHGYAGPKASMPAWGEHPYVSRYYAELWRYLGARASGELPAGEPVLEESSAQAP